LSIAFRLLPIRFSCFPLFGRQADSKMKIIAICVLALAAVAFGQVPPAISEEFTAAVQVLSLLTLSPAFIFTRIVFIFHTGTRFSLFRGAFPMFPRLWACGSTTSVLAIRCKSGTCPVSMCTSSRSTTKCDRLDLFIFNTILDANPVLLCTCVGHRLYLYSCLQTMPEQQTQWNNGKMK
jgi:hypothetical protein